MTYMEKVSDEEAKQAGIAFEGVFEFPFDVAFEPYTKWAIEPIPPATLTEHQERIMQIVRRKCRLG